MSLHIYPKKVASEDEDSAFLAIFMGTGIHELFYEKVVNQNLVHGQFSTDF